MLRFPTCLVVLLLVAARASALPAQDPALVEALAPLLRLEDQKVFDAATLQNAAVHLNPLVRRTAALVVGRIGDRTGEPLLVHLLNDPDPAVVRDAFFALGLLGDSAATDAILTRLRAPDTLAADAVGEAATALIRLGSSEATAFVGRVLQGTGELAGARRTAFLPNALLDAWHLGKRTPVNAILPFLTDSSSDLRWRASYTLGRVRAPVAADQLLRQVRDPSAFLRETAAKALVRRFVDSTGLAGATVERELTRLLDDDQPGVRITALGSLASFADSTLSSRAATLLRDPDRNVRVAAANALGSLRGPAATAALSAVLDKNDNPWAVRRAALLALARIDTAAFAARVAPWLASTELRDRLAALQGWGSVRGASRAIFQGALADPVSGVRAAALDAWAQARSRADTVLLRRARELLDSHDSDVRASAAGVLRGQVSIDDLDRLLGAWRASLSDGESDARLAVFSDIADLARRDSTTLAHLQEPSRIAFLARPADALVRQAAQAQWPVLAKQWGPVAPVETGHTIEDYRGIVRTVMLATSNPHVTIELDGRGTIELELFAQDAPLTVANFLRLVDRHYFDGNQWHRVVPDFVVQDGDRTGTGNGGPGWVIRDEINRWRYALPMIGMALSGPDTGGSQWFINLSPQPHLDGTYTIFGQVVGSYVGLGRVVQGDVIRAIHR